MSRYGGGWKSWGWSPSEVASKNSVSDKTNWGARLLHLRELFLFSSTYTLAWGHLVSFLKIFSNESFYLASTILDFTCLAVDSGSASSVPRMWPPPPLCPVSSVS